MEEMWNMRNLPTNASSAYYGYSSESSFDYNDYAYVGIYTSLPYTSLILIQQKIPLSIINILKLILSVFLADLDRELQCWKHGL
ncbi:unnamed protein product [Urochloa humidicola]